MGIHAVALLITVGAALRSDSSAGGQALYLLIPLVTGVVTLALIAQATGDAATARPDLPARLAATIGAVICALFW